MIISVMLVAKSMRPPNKRELDNPSFVSPVQILVVGVMWRPRIMTSVWRSCNQGLRRREPMLVCPSCVTYFYNIVDASGTEPMDAP